MTFRSLSKTTFVCITAVSLLTMILLTFAAPAPSIARNTPPDDPKAKAGHLTHNLVTLFNRYLSADPDEQEQLKQELMNIATERQQVLLSIIEQNPAEVIRLAVPASTRAALPSAVHAYIEEEVDIEGTLELLDMDFYDHSRLSYFLVVGDERLEIHFADHRPDHLLTGAKIRVKGIKVANTLALAGGKKAVKKVSPAPVLQTLGEQRTLVILVNFQDNPVEPYTVDEAEYIIFGETSDFFLENSYQKTWLSGDVVGWFTIPLNSTACYPLNIANEAKSAASASGIDLSSYTHYVYAFPRNSCGFWGLSTVGGNPSQAWINGKLEIGVTGHELGHGMGLLHSHSLDCGSTTVGANCTDYEYGDTVDIMGSSSYAHFNAFQKERLGWLNAGSSPLVITVEESGTYIIRPYESVGSEPRALKILKSKDPNTGQRTWYYVEFRQPIGFDGYIAEYGNVSSGILVHHGTESNVNSSYLLDMNPGTGSSQFWEWKDPALTVGQSFQDPESGMTLTTQWATESEAAVNVTLGSIEPNGSAEVTISTDQPTYTLNQFVYIKATVQSGGAPLENTTVNFIVKKPTGTSVSGEAATDSSGNAVYKLRLKRQDLTGLYEAQASVSTEAAISSGSTNSSASILFTVY